MADMEILRASFQVSAGVIPGHPDKELGRVWLYTSSDFEKDLEWHGEGESIFQRKMREALEYSHNIIDPARLNWVTFDFFWA